MIDFSKMTKKDVGKCFDYFIGPKDTTEAIIREECKTAIEYNVKAFCFSSSIDHVGDRAAANHHGHCYLSGRWGGTHTADFQRSAVYYAEPLWDSSWSGDCGLLLPDGRFRGSEL